MNEKEAKILKALNDKQYKNFPKLKIGCLFDSKPTLIMEQFGPSLQFYFKNFPNGFSYKTTHQIGIKMITLLEQLHSIGYVHSDLKPDNICIGDGKNVSTLSDLKLIDFGCCQHFSKNADLMKEPQNDDEHREYGPLKNQGNLVFASPNFVNCVTLSRRDDLISLFYLLLYLRSKTVPFYDPYIKTGQKKKIKQKKLNTTHQ